MASNHVDTLHEDGIDGKNEQKRREVVGKFFLKHWKEGKKATVNHFVGKGMNRLVVYRILQRLEINGSVDRKRRESIPRHKIPQKVINQIKNQIMHRVGTSQRKLARKFKISQSSVSNIIKESELKYYKRQTIPDVSEKQEKKVKTACSKLRKDFFAPKSGVKMVLDDESYFPFRNNEIPGNSGFYAKRDLGPSSAPHEVRFTKEKKFPEKILVWMVISEDAISEPFFVKSKLAMKGDIYRKDCIQKILYPFLQKYHRDGRYYFWPDLASCHYAKETLNLLKSLKINYIPRDSNPPNSPQLRPIETFWARLKGKVYEGGWEASSERQLKQRIRMKVREMDTSESQILSRSVRKDIRKTADAGYLATMA